LILASSSPQRERLLAEAGYCFGVLPPSPQAECGVCSGESPAQMVCRLARRKAEDTAAQLADGWPAQPRAGSTGGQATHGTPDCAAAVVACDTVAVCDGRILGKPADVGDARQMLHWLRGREHEVLSGLCVLPLAGGPTRVELARTRLRMDHLSDEQIEEYLESGQWEGKAGAFGYQDRVGWLHIVEGSESNVIGLPLELLDQILKEAGLGDPSGKNSENPRR
jgi:septum formation protein